MSAITAALGTYATLGIKRVGNLVTKTFDESLMSINYARAAATDFASMQAALARRAVTAHGNPRRQLDQKIAALNQSLADDLTIAAEHSQSKRVAHAAERVRRAVTAWNNLRLLLMENKEPRVMWETLDHYATIVEQQIDLLVNYTTSDGFLYRQSTRASVASDIRLNFAGTALAILLSVLVAWLLARRIIGPVAMASAVAERIAHGKLDGDIPRGAGDELGALLAAMATMRDNIKAMMEREVAQRRSAQARLADALESSREGIIVVDADGQVALANSQAADFLGGWGSPTQPGSLASDLAVPPLTRMDKPVVAHAPTRSSTGEVALPDGRWLRISRSTTREGGFIVVCSDISVQKEQEARLRETNLRLDTALDNMSHGLCLYDANDRLQVVNRRFCEIFHLEPARVQPGLTFHDIVALSVAAGNHGGKTVQDILAEQSALPHHNNDVQTYFLELSTGRSIAVTHRRTADGGWVATYEDVTERRHAEAQISFMARHDTLTHLPNRALLNERIEQAVAQLGRGHGLAILCVDLDNFKQINDTLGHPIGDALLVAVAERLRSCVREVDTVARLGGDEFAIVQCGIGAPEDAALLARRVVETLSAPYDIEGHCVMVGGASLGISVAPGDGVTCERLLKNADVALYRAKSEGRGTWRFFEPEMDARLQARRKLELDLRDALNKGQFDLYYQPLYDLELNRVCGFEALLRWRHPARGFVPPSEFISVAEEIGLIVPIGNWVLERACTQAAEWPGHVKIAINVSPAQFKGPGLVQSVSDALAKSGLSPQRLELEITESVLLTNSVATLAILYALRDRGIRISMDDFGTGYSSLSYLRSFPFDKIKIDQSFVRDIAAPGESGLIVRAIIGLSRSLGMRTTAEGVETEEQFARLRREGCDEVQGYLFGMPALPHHIPKLLKRTLAERMHNDADAHEAPSIVVAG